VSPSGGVVAAALVPGMPHLLAGDPAPAWRELADGTRTVGDRLRAAGVETVLLLSTQWFTVLGHQVQCDPHLQGARTDENWYRYDYGHLRYDLRIDVEVARGWADGIDAAGMQARRTRYDGFPVDTGTVTASQLLDPDGRGRWALVSCNLYADPDAMAHVAAAGVRAAAALGRRAGVVAVSGLSSGLTPRWISPADDRVADAEHDRWNRTVLEAMRAGDRDGVLALRAEYARAAQADSQFRAFAFLAGSGAVDGPGEVLAYGPVWGTGAAVVWWGAPAG
jgi:2-aminophenol/2-amino-5-chlorophenol 1,6-dioxygenase alpha subunit